MLFQLSKYLSIQIKRKKRSFDSRELQKCTLQEIVSRLLLNNQETKINEGLRKNLFNNLVR